MGEQGEGEVCSCVYGCVRECFLCLCEGGKEKKMGIPALSPAIITFPGFLPRSSRTYLRLSAPCSSCLGYVAYGASM